MTPVTWSLLAALCWGVAPLVEKSGLRNAPPMAGLFYRCVGVLIGMALLAIFLVKPQEIRSVEPRSALLLIAGGFLASILGQICFYTGLKGGDVSRLVPISGSYPVIAFCLGILIFGESLTVFKALGVVLVVTGVALLRL
jgi:bacterial/archaeal transporter family protein